MTAEQERAVSRFLFITPKTILAALRGQGWRDIESAPKEGEVLLYWPPTPEGDLPEHMAICDHRGGPFRRPTHWMPLPAPPEPKP